MNVDDGRPTGDAPGGTTGRASTPPAGFADVDAASCAALGGHLVQGARRLHEAAGPDDAHVRALLAAMTDLGTALGDLAQAAREGRPTRPGLPHPRTVVRSAARGVLTALAADTPPTSSPGATTAPPLP